jgi:hypothetical protein
VDAAFLPLISPYLITAGNHLASHCAYCLPITAIMATWCSTHVPYSSISSSKAFILSCVDELYNERYQSHSDAGEKQHS